jgi:lipopolysaccharide transport system permease protein
VLVMGYSLALAALNVYFRDVQHLISIALQVWFYLTPVVYPIANESHVYIPVSLHRFGVTIPVRRIYELNPMVHVVTAYRNVLYDGRFPGGASFAYLVGSSFAVLAIGWTIFRRLEPRMVEEL